MSLLSAATTVTYNGYTFNGSVRSSLTGRMVYDAAGRTVTHVVYTLTISSYIPEPTPGSGTDTTILDIRRRLSTPGQALAITATGLGDFSINVSGVNDVVWGPKPTMLALESIGAAACWRIDWSCEVAIPECSAAQYAGTPMAFNYEVSYAIDEDGYTTRTVSGYLEIPLTRDSGGRTVNDTALNYRDRFVLPIPPLFRRTRREWKESADRRRLDFTIVDEEMPVEALPAGCTRASGEFSFQSTVATLTAFQFHLSATYTVAPRRGRQIAWDHFYALWFDRTTWLRSRYGVANVLAVSFAAREGLYQNSRTVGFEASWAVTSGDVSTIMGASGLYRPVPNTNYQQWAISAGVVQAQSFGGNMGLVPVGGDIIVDLCGGTATLRGDAGKVQLRAGEPPGQKVDLRSPGWLDYQGRLRIEMDPATVTLQALPVDPLNAPNLTTGLKSGRGLDLGDLPRVSTNPGGRPGTRDEILKIIAQNQAQGLPSFTGLFPAGTVKGGEIKTIPTDPTQYGQMIAQQRNAPSFRLRMTGYATTIGFVAPCPSVVEFAGFLVVPVGPQAYIPKTIGQLAGLPVNRADWDLVYQILT